MKSVIKYILTVTCRVTYCLICLITAPIIGVLIVFDPLLWVFTGNDMLLFDLIGKIGNRIRKTLGIKSDF
jgi:hypothetical protein